MRHAAGLREFEHAYDGFVVDLWGVVHDGVHVLPGAAECLGAMRDAGKRIVLLSNAPRRAGAVARQLDRMGVPPTLYDGLVTSGEVTRSMLLARSHPFFAALGRTCRFIGPERDLNLVEGTEIRFADAIADADFLLNTGPDDERPEALETFLPLLEQAAARDLPMVCANPDLEVVRGGRRVICAGTLAALYHERGGRICLVGKPDPLVYDPVIETLDVPRDRVAGIGDALATDISGAAAAGIDALWVLGGIHAELRADPPAAATLAAARGLAPVATLPGLVW